MAKRDNQSGGCLGYIVVFGGILAFGVWSASKGLEDQQRREADPTSGAAYACREFISRSLISPSSAEWGAWSRWPASEQDDGSVRVQATFDAANSFGAQIRQRMTCEVIKRDGNWYLVALSE